MRSPSSCRHCNCPLEVEPPSGLCATCLRLADTSHDDVPRTPTPVPFPVPLVPDHPSSQVTTGFTPSDEYGPTISNVPSDVTSASNITALTEHPLPPAPAGYDLYAHLGGGGMGDVFLAQEHFTERWVAMKFLRAAGNRSAMERFLIEVRSLAAIKHPNILQVLATDFLRSDPFFTTELANGGSLGKWVEARGPFDPTDAARIMSVVARAMQAAHESGILHRDLKPSNILLASDRVETRMPHRNAKSADTPNPIRDAGVKTAGPISAGSDRGVVTGGGRTVADFPPDVTVMDFQPKIGDFGLAKRMDHDDGATIGTGPIGTPSYMPPEQITKLNGEVGPASDVYGLGATLFHLLTGRPPFGPGEQTEVIQAVLAEPPPRPRAIRPEVSLKLDGIVVKCLEKDPTDRYASAAALADDLDAFLAGGATVAPQLTFVRRVRRWMSRNSKALAGSILLVMLAAGLVGAGVAMAPKPVEQPEVVKVDPWLAIERELDDSDGRTPIVLIGEKGMPRYSKWHLSQPIVGESSTQDGSMEVQTRSITYLELVRDPKHESYRIVAQLMHRAGSGKGTAVGVFLGYEPLTIGADDTLHPAVVSWHDEINNEEIDRFGLPTRMHQTSFVYIVPRCEPERDPFMYTHGGGPRMTSLWYTPRGDQVASPWRTLVIDVSREGVVFQWNSGEDDKGKPLAQPLSDALKKLERADELSADLINRERQYLHKLLLRDNIAVAIPEWNPRKPLGIWVLDGTVSIRNVTILPKVKRQA